MAHERDIQIRLESDVLMGDELEIGHVEGNDRISQLFRYTIRAARVDGAMVDPDELLLKPASLAFTAGGEEIHRLFGLISEVRDLAEPQMQHPRMELTFVPRAFAATMRETLDIFMEMSVPDIIDACLTRCGLTAGDHYDLGGLTGSYDPKEYVVQYKETDFAFISRLCEHVGIFFFVDHSAGKDVLTFGDSNAAFPTIERTPEIPFLPIETAGGEFTDRIGSVDVVSRALPKRYTVRDYNYRTPGVDLMASADVDPNGLGEIVEYGAHFKGPNEGQGYADIRAQELLAGKRIWSGLGTAPSLSAGLKFMLTAHPAGDVELLLTGVTHRWSSEDGEEDSEFPTAFSAIPAETRYRPPRLTPKPKVTGAITGMIDAAVQDDFAEVDDQGRYRVRFMFDTATRGEGQASRLVRMAQPHAGEGYGMHFPLRPGIEVLLTCMDGDPDRPVITGTVPNPKTASPVSSANRDRNLIRTGGGNEIDISDEDGVQRIKMTTPHMGTVFQLGAPNEPEVGAVIKTSGNVVGQAADTFASAASMWSAMADVHGAVVGTDITYVAGIPTPLEGFDKYAKFASSGLKAAQGLAGLIDSVTGFDSDLAKSSKKQAEDAKKQAEDDILDQRTPKAEYPRDAQMREIDYANGQTVQVRETEEQFRQRLIDEQVTAMSGKDRRQHTSALADATAAADAATANFNKYKPSSTKSWTEPTKDAAAALEKGVAAAKSAKDLYSNVHKKTQQKIADLAWTMANSHATAASAAVIASNPRHKASFRDPGKHYHLISATDSVVFNGQQGNYLVGLTTAVHGETRCVVSSNLSLDLDGGAHAELAAQTVRVTGNLLVDVLSRQALKIESTNDTDVKVGDKMSVTSGDDMSVESKKNYRLNAKDRLHGKAKEIKWEAKQNSFTVKAKQDIVGSATRDVKFVSDRNALVHGKTAAIVKSDKGGLLSKSSETAIDHQKSNKLVLKSNSATLKSSKVDLQGRTSVKIKGRSVTVNGSNIKLG